MLVLSRLYLSTWFNVTTGKSEHSCSVFIVSLCNCSSMAHVQCTLSLGLELPHAI